MWDWLGIPQTEEIAAIKKAFAEKSKEYHPEEFPQEFQALQKAYPGNGAADRRAGAGIRGADGTGAMPVRFVCSGGVYNGRRTGRR